MTLKTTTKQKGLFIGLVIFWVLYYMQAYSLFSEVGDFITPGSSYMIKVLEFTNYRADQLSLLLIEYFVLISISIALTLFLCKKIVITKNKVLPMVSVITIIFVTIICIISNIFWSIYLLLTLLSALIIAASIFVSSVMWGATVTFDEGDIVFLSKGFKTKELAESSLNDQLKKLDKKNRTKLFGEIFEVDKEYFFEIYANDKIILDNKGEFNFHEEI